VDDIAKLGEKECAMLRIDSDDDDGGAKTRADSQDDRKAGAAKSQVEDGLGKSEEDAIVLLDDDEDDDELLVVESTAPAQTSATADRAPTRAIDLHPPVPAVATAYNSSSQATYGSSRFRLYKLRMDSPKLGVELRMYKGRPFVARAAHDRDTMQLGTKPDVGDLLVGINGWPLPLVHSVDDVVRQVRAALSSLPAEITFAECPALRQSFLAAQEAQARAQQQKRDAHNRAAAQNVIEIADDDDD
jgi:hypothetical protein